MNRVDPSERAAFFRHPAHPAMGLLKARFRTHRYDLHTHPTYVIALVTAGREQVRLGRTRVGVEPGQVLVVNPEEPHDGEAGCESGWSYRTFYPPPALMAQAAGELGQPMPRFHPAAIADPALADALALAHHQAEQADADAEATLLLAIGRLLAHAGDSRPIRPPPASARRMATYRDLIAADPAQPHTLESLATACGVTRFQVIRDFRHATGLTPGTYLRDRRVRMARALIEQGAPLAEAALAAGFADQSHLSRAFKQAQGFSPGKLRT